MQRLLRGQLLEQLTQSLHGTALKQPAIFKSMQEIRQKYNFPSLVTYVRNWVPECELCIQDKRENNTQGTPKLTPKQRRKRFRTRRSYANQSFARSTAKSKLRSYYSRN